MKTAKVCADTPIPSVSLGDTTWYTRMSYPTFCILWREGPVLRGPVSWATPLYVWHRDGHMSMKSRYFGASDRGVPSKHPESPFWFCSNARIGIIAQERAVCKEPYYLTRLPYSYRSLRMDPSLGTPVRYKPEKKSILREDYCTILTVV